MEDLGNTIKERRKALSITQRELAALAGVGINTLTKIERDEANPSLKVIMDILNTLGLEIDIKIKFNKLCESVFKKSEK
jgi:y4mF family transcriptional regulator